MQTEREYIRLCGICNRRPDEKVIEKGERLRKDGTEFESEGIKLPTVSRLTRISRRMSMIHER